MISIEEIKEPISADFQLFEAKFRASFQTDNALLAKINRYILHGNGKNLRPIITMLSARLFGECNDASLESAVSLELLHTASLIHDDIVDDTMERRGRPSINSQWNNKIAVLVGDFLLSKSLSHAAKTENLEIMKLIADIGINLSDGELLQMSKENRADTSEIDYLTVIRKKTALLFASCAKMGALSVGAEAAQAKKMGNFGEYMGICFQIKDDIFDYSENIKIGKPTGNDIREGKITLPLIFALNNSVSEKKNEIAN